MLLHSLENSCQGIQDCKFHCPFQALWKKAQLGFSVDIVDEQALKLADTV